MKSRDSIKKSLVEIANNNGYQGEIVEVAANMLSYVLFHDQIEILNSARESSLSTAKLMNSKITECMNVMYSVYRGKNARVTLNFINNTIINKSKYEQVYESNTFKLFACDTVNMIVQQENNQPKIQQMTLMFSQARYDYEVTIDSNNKYFIDVLDEDGHPLTDLSEEIRVTIRNSENADEIEYPTTRDFYDHINTAIPEDSNNRNELDKIFILTTTDFGVRLFKRGYRDDDGKTVGYFKEGDIVHVTCFKYMRAEEINTDEYNRIILQGTTLRAFQNETFDGANTGRKLIDEIAREDQNSVLYNANSSTRTQSKILSNSDVAHLFSEFFIDDVLSSAHRYESLTQEVLDTNATPVSEDTLHIFYLPRQDNYIIPVDEVMNFKTKYKSYFISHDIDAYPAQIATVNVLLSVFLNTYDEISEDLTAIFSNYENRLTQRSNYTELDFKDSDSLRTDFDYYSQLFDLRDLHAQISKLSQVAYIEQLSYDSVIFESDQEHQSFSTEQLGNRLPTSILTSYIMSDGRTVLVRVPVAYKFNLSISYKNSYEIIS